jgi:hypothetical protein
MEPPTSTPSAPSTDLDRAAQLSATARRSTRWYSHYLAVFAAASFLLAVLTGVFSGPSGVAVTSSLWAVFVVVSSVWAARKPTAIRGMTRLHLAVMAGWTLAWGLTVVLGSLYFRDQLWWWLLGAVAVAAAPVAGAVAARRRTA